MSADRSSGSSAAQRNAARVAEILRRMGTEDFEGTRQLLAPGFVQEWPYPPGEGAPERMDGREPFIDFLQGMTAMHPFRYTIEQLYELADPAVVIAEYSSHTSVRATGQPYQNRYVGIFRFADDGLLEFWREYLNPELINRLGLS